MKYNTEQSEKIIDDAMAALNLSFKMKTDVQLVQQIFSDINLNNFQTTYLPMKQFFDDIVSRPQNLESMLTQIKSGLLKHGAAIVEFLAIALSKNWLMASPYVIQSVHVAYILEAITAAMCNSNLFFSEYVEHIRLKEKDIGIDSEHLFKTFFKTLPGSLNFFATAKAISLDMAMVYFRVTRELAGRALNKQSIDQLYEAGKISFLEHKLLLPLCQKGHCVCHDWLRINIYEAGVTEYKNGFTMNAMAAHVLSEDVLRHCHPETYQLRQVYPQGANGELYPSLVGDENYFPVVKLRGDWKNLYLSWNMAFILGELNNLHYLFPKLLIPSVLCSDSENFLGVRIISLWVSINNSLFLNFNRVEKSTAPENRREMALAWGEINQKYAEELYQTYIDPNTNTLLSSFQNRFSHPFIHLTK